MRADPPMAFDDWVRTRLFAQRTVLVSGDLDTGLATAAAELMTLDGEGDELITLHLDCSGGSLEAAFTLIDVVDLIGAPVHAVAADLRSGRHLSPEEARTYGLIDEIVTGQAEVRRLPGRSFGFQA